MLQKFFVNTIESKFIKQLLSTIPLPMYDTINFGDTIINGYTYIYKNNIVRCTKTGVFAYNSGLFPSEKLFPGDYLYPQDISAGFDIVGTYDFGEFYTGVTSIYQNKYQYYDVDTHIRLGNYLRCLRDIKSLDLMPFYNCFAYQLLHGYHIEKVDTTYQILDYETEDIKCLLVPIKFNTSYTIALNSLSKIIISPVILNKTKNNYIINEQRTEWLHSEVETLGGKAFTVKSGLNFNNPFKIKFNTRKDIYDSTNVYRFEDQLYMMMQLSKSNNTSVVVLETDAILDSGHMHFSTDRLDSLSISDLTSYFSSELSLLKTNDSNIYAFSNRLMEYLLLNAINNTETIGQNIYMAQYKSGFVTSPECVNGVWDIILRQYIYHKYMNDTKLPNKVVSDINGYIDKDIERFLDAQIELTELLSIQVVDINDNPVTGTYSISIPSRINVNEFETIDTSVMQYYELDKDVKIKFSSPVYSVISMKMKLLNDNRYKSLAFINNDVWTIDNPNKDFEIIITVKER